MGGNSIRPCATVHDGAEGNFSHGGGTEGKFPLSARQCLFDNHSCVGNRVFGGKKVFCQEGIGDLSALHPIPRPVKKEVFPGWLRLAGDFFFALMAAMTFFKGSTEVAPNKKAPSDCSLSA
jgi:hypothetical protein